MPPQFQSRTRLKPIPFKDLKFTYNTGQTISHKRPAPNFASHVIQLVPLPREYEKRPCSRCSKPDPNNDACRMDHHYLATQRSPQQSISRHNISARQPVSCEPCRQRKIKCSRTKPVCDTCQRRRCVDRCIYKNVRDGGIVTITASANDELLNRISNLEQLLKKHTGAEIPGFVDEYSMIPSPPVDVSQNSQLSPESFVSDNSHQISTSDYQSPLSSGVLTSTSSGNVRYEPRSSQWTSVLANTNLSIETPSLDDQEGSSIAFGFPFIETTAPSIEELLSSLPPMQQCDYLKNQYFAVFSPVCALPNARTTTNSNSSFTSFMIRHFIRNMLNSSNIRLQHHRLGLPFFSFSYLSLSLGWKTTIRFFET